MKKEFKDCKIVACIMAHHDDQFIDRLLENLNKFTSDFYINLNNATQYTKNACISNKNTKKYIITNEPWRQGYQREITARLVDEVEPDIVLFPDSDELYCDDLMETLEKFWESDKKGCWFEMKYCWGDENTVRLDHHFQHMIHVRAFKWIPNISYEGYRGYACPINYFHEKRTKFVSLSPVKHLKFLKKENLERVKEESKEKGFYTRTYNKFNKHFGE